MVYGPMEACPICGGSLELVGSSYSCMGFISEWSKCNFSTRDISWTNENLNIPSGVKNEFIEEWSRNYQASTDRPKRELPPTDQPFSGMTIAFAGRMSRSKVATLTCKFVFKKIPCKFCNSFVLGEY